MQVGFHHFDSGTLDWRAGVLRSGGLSRHALGRGLCEQTDWRNAQGKPCLSAAADPMKRVPAFLPEGSQGKLTVVGAGKASARMTQAVETVWQGPPSDTPSR